MRAWSLLTLQHGERRLGDYLRLRLKNLVSTREVVFGDAQVHGGALNVAHYCRDLEGGEAIEVSEDVGQPPGEHFFKVTFWIEAGDDASAVPDSFILVLDL